MVTRFTDPPINTTSISELLTFLQGTTGGWFGNLILISFFLVVFVALKGYSTPKAAVIASFSTLILGWFLVGLELVTQYAILVCFIIMIASFIGVYLEGKR